MHHGLSELALCSHIKRLGCEPIAYTASTMILGPISLIDCLVFVIFLIPQLLWRVGLFKTIITGIKALPFLGMSLTTPFGSG